MSNRVIKPGEILKKEFMNPIDLSAKDLSLEAKIPFSTLLGTFLDCKFRKFRVHFDSKLNQTFLD